MKKLFRQMILLSVVTISLTGCSSFSEQTATPLEEALEIAGENRGELEKVLQHYQGGFS